MTEQGGGEPSQSGGENVGVNEDVKGEPRERKDAAGATPPIGDEGQSSDRTTAPAPSDDVGVPPDEEMNRES